MSPDYMSPDRQHRLALPRNDQDPYQLGPSDTERLDWLQERAFGLYQDRDPENGQIYHAVVCDEDAGEHPRHSRHGHVGKTVRDAIDEAMRCNRGHVHTMRPQPGA